VTGFPYRQTVTTNVNYNYTLAASIDWCHGTGSKALASLHQSIKLLLDSHTVSVRVVWNGRHVCHLPVLHQISKTKHQLLYPARPLLLYLLYVLSSKHSRYRPEIPKVTCTNIQKTNLNNTTTQWQKDATASRQFEWNCASVATSVVPRGIWTALWQNADPTVEWMSEQ